MADQNDNRPGIPAPPPHKNDVRSLGRWPIGGDGASDRNTLLAANCRETRGTCRHAFVIHASMAGGRALEVGEHVVHKGSRQSLKRGSLREQKVSYWHVHGHSVEC